ncbi:MAG: hypothetical protein KGL16_08990 [Acidobacteriota bacterium]|nr:hypothetical protein [Acidobacteriota bacterium]
MTRSRSIRPLRVLSLVAVLAACLALPAVAGATSYSMKWGRSVPLLNPNVGGGFASIGCAPAAAGSKSLLCVAGDVRGEVFASVHPAQSAAQWHRQRLEAKNTISGVSCPSTQLCVAVDSAGEVMHSTNPTGGAKYWSRPVRVDKALATGGGYAGFAAISCPTTTFCLAVDNAANGQIAYTTNPTGPASAWTLTTVGNGVMLDSVSCVSATLCLIGGSQAYYSADPTGGATAWKAVAALGTSDSVIAALACNTAKLCLGVGYGNAGVGLAVGSSTPTTISWSLAPIGSDPPATGAGIVDSVACPQRNLCVAVDTASNYYTSSTPVRGRWSAGKPLKRASQSTFSQVACEPAFCVEVDDRGTVTYGVVKGASTTTSTKPTTTTKTTTTSTNTTTTASKTG